MMTMKSGDTLGAEAGGGATRGERATWANGPNQAWRSSMSPWLGPSSLAS
jgi:hypothetical protein